MARSPLGAFVERTMKLGCALLAAILVLSSAERIRAQIYEWDDANGRHFADSLEGVPNDARAGARLMIKEGARPAPAPAPAEERPDQTESKQNGPSEEEVTTMFASGWDRGFQAGWEAGYQAAINEPQVCTSEPEVVVLQSPPATVNVPVYDPTGAYYVSPYEGTVTVPFDQGRSFGLTRREQMQRLQGR